MDRLIIFIAIGVIFHSHAASAIWFCSEDSECSSLTGSVCREGSCACDLGQQPVLGGTLCADLAPYHSSPCIEDHQCSRIFSNYVCRRNGNTGEGTCGCRTGHHYFRGRCWSSANYGEVCTRDEECFGVLRDPYNMVCNGSCVCAGGYYLRQRGECRKIGQAVGDACVLNDDCQFPNGGCDQNTFRCYNINDMKETTPEDLALKVSDNMASETKQNGGFVACNVGNACPEPFECSKFGVCFCPIGYYNSGNNTCLADLSSPATEEQCKGLLAVVVDGFCTCPANFYFDLNMRDCVKVTRRFTESCLTDLNCHTFGAASRCGPPQAPWGLRTCECIPELAVWDSQREMCRSFAGIGETCEVDSDCLAGELEIQCVQDEAGQGYCACPEGLEAVGGLCLTTGLELGDACQVTEECTGAQHSVCEGGRCTCGDGYQEAGGICAPVIGGTCYLDTDCVLPDTACLDWNGTLTCQCDPAFVEYEDVCWAESQGFGASCNVSAQCTRSLGDAGGCTNGSCACSSSHHYRDGRCWPMTGLFEACARSSECYLAGEADRVVCRNGLCQCSFEFPYSEESHTCTSSAAQIGVNFLLIASTIIYSLSS